MADVGKLGTTTEGVTLLRLAGADAPIVEALLDGVVVTDSTGTIIYANQAVETLLGWPPAVLQDQPVTVLIPARLRTFHESGFAAFAAGGPARIVGQPVHVPALRIDGAETPIELLLSVLPLRSGERLVVATLRNVAQWVDLERYGQVVDRLLALLARGPAGLGPRLLGGVADSLDWDVAVLWMVGVDGETLESRDVWHRPGVELGAFRSATESLVLTVGEGLPGRVLGLQAPTWIVDLALDPNFLRGEAAKAIGLRSGCAFPVMAGSRVVGVVELFARQRRESDEGLLAAFDAIGQRVGDILAHAEAERERERLLAELRTAQAAEHRLVRAQDFLLLAARALAEAKDYTEALDRLAAVAVPLLGDLCLIDVLGDDDRTLERMAARHADPAKQAIVDELRALYAPDPDGAHPTVEVMRTGQSVWSSEMPEEFLRATTRDQYHFDLVTKLEFTSFMSVPLTAGDRVLGSLTLVSAGSGRRFQESDLDLAEELAGHAAAVIDRARRHDREREAAHALQRSLLPDELASVAGVATAAGYLAGTEGAEVGGDWYDVIPLPSGAVGLVIGDVAGHDIGAAGVMGQLRNALRAYAVREDSPAAVLDQLREFAEVLDIDRIATVAYLWLSPLSGELRVASAGHLPPLLRRRSGAVELMRITPAPPLGVPSAAPPETRVQLDVDDTVILLTDGLIETRGEDFDQGVDNLRTLIEGLGDVSPLDLCDQILAWRLGTARRDDDMCLLAARRT